MGPTLFVDVSYNSGIVCSNQNMTAQEYCSPVMEGQYYCPELQYIDVELSFGTGSYTRNLRIPMWAPPPWVEASVKMVNSAWKGQIGIPDVRNDRSCHCLSRVTGSERHGVENQFVRPNELKCRLPSGMRPEAQLSNPINWDTSLYDKVFWEDIWHDMCHISRALNTGREALP